VGDVRAFWTMQADGTSYRKVRAALVFEGRLARIWVDVRDTGRIPVQVMTGLQRALDTATGSESRDPSLGIIENEWEVFGRSPATYKLAGKDDFLMTDLPNTVAGMTLLGYFHTKDQYPRSLVPSSNELNLLYIDSREGARDLPRLLGTIAHEYQHLIGFGRNPEGERFFSEGLSELASLLIGYRHANPSFLANPNAPMFRFSETDPDEVEVDYERGMSLMAYLHEQYGDAFVRELVGARGKGVERIEMALRRIGVDPETDGWHVIAERFAVANYLQSEGAGAFGYRRTLASARMVRAASIGATELPHYEKPVARLQPNGVAYVEYEQVENLALRIPAGEHRALAIVFDAGVPAVRTLRPGVNTIESAQRVVLVLVNTSERTNAVEWQIERESPVAFR
jgi:hypothetical protein